MWEAGSERESGEPNLILHSQQSHSGDGRRKLQTALVALNIVFLVMVFLVHFTTLTSLSGTNLQITFSYPNFSKETGRTTSSGAFEPLGGVSGTDITLFVFIAALIVSAALLVSQIKEKV